MGDYPKTFFGRRWAINKLVRYVNSDPSSPDDSSHPRTVLIVGGSGCGKTALISHVVSNANDALIFPQIGCAIYADRFTSPTELLLSMNAQFHNFFKCRGLTFSTLTDKSDLRSLVPNEQDFGVLNQRFHSLVLQPLLSVHWRSCSKVVLFIDNIDVAFNNNNKTMTAAQVLNNNGAADLNDSVVSSSLSDTSSSKDNLSNTNSGNVLTNLPVLDLFLQNSANLPPWLLLVASCNRRSKRVIRGISAYTACRKFILDDTKRTEVADDLTSYCQMRINTSPNSAVFLGDNNKATSDLIEKLLIKSNGCILYLEKAFDLLLSRRLLPSEVSQLPATLNGFYLWLCERAFTGVDFQREVRPFFAALVRDKSLPFDDSLHSSFPSLANLLATRPLLEHILVVSNSNIVDMLSPTSRGAPSLAVSFFHPSFSAWLTDLKLCTRRFVVDTPGDGFVGSSCTDSESQRGPRAGKTAAAAAAAGKRSNRSPRKVQSSTKGNPAKMQPSMAAAQQAISFGPRQQQQQQQQIVTTVASSSSAAIDDFRKKLFTAIENGDADLCQDLLRRPNSLSRASRPSLSSTSESASTTTAVDSTSIASAIEIRDEFGQTPLILASKCGFEKIVQLLIDLGANIEASDCDGWTPLRSAAWSGHIGVIDILIAARANVNLQLDPLPDGESRNNGNNPLEAAILNGQLEAVRRLVQNGAAVNAADSDGRTPFMTACMACRPEIVQQLLAIGAEIDARDSSERTCLHMALSQGPLSPAEEDSLLQVMTSLIDAGCQVEAVDNEGTAPLHLAASRGLVQACELLLENDCDVDLADSYGRTALFLAASHGHEEALRMLLYWNASVDAIDAQGWSALSVASRFGDVGCVEMLLDRGLDENHCDNDGSTALHLAAAGNHVRICEMLIERGARVDALGASGRTPLMVAAAAGHVPVITCLLRAGSNPLLVDISGLDPLRMAIAAEQWPAVRVLARYSDVNAPDPAGHPPLFTAAFSNSATLATVLLQCGAHPNLCDANGRSPLHVAAWQGHCDVLKIVINFNANVNAVDNEGRSALHSAAWQGNLTACRILLEAGAAVDHVCAQGATALCIAAQEGHADLVQLLLDFGANPGHVDQYGRTALRMALKNSHMEVVRILEGMGEVAAGTGNSQTSNDSAFTRNTYTSGSGGDHPGAIVTSLSGGGIIVSPAGTGTWSQTNGSQLLQNSQIDSSTGDSQSGGGSITFGMAATDFIAVSSDKIVGTRSFERGMRQRRSIAANAIGRLPDGDVLMTAEEVQPQFMRGVNVRRSLQPQSVSGGGSGGGGVVAQHYRYAGQHIISGGIEYEEDCMNSYAALSNAFDGVNISSLDEQAERLAGAYRMSGGVFPVCHGKMMSHTDDLYVVPNGSSSQAMMHYHQQQQHHHQGGGRLSMNPPPPTVANGKTSSSASSTPGSGGKQPKFLSSLLKKMLPARKQTKQTNSGFVK